MTNTPEVQSRFLSILPPITQAKVANDIPSNLSMQQRVTILEEKSKNLETANFKLIEIVYQLKNALISNKPDEYGDKSDMKTSNIVIQQLENRLKRLERNTELRTTPITKEIDLYDNSFNHLSNRLISIDGEIENVNTEKARLENMLMKLTEEMVLLKNQIVIQGDLLTSTSNQYNNKTKRLQNEYANNLDSITDKMVYTQETARQMANNSVSHGEFNDILNNIKHDYKEMRIKFEEQTHSYSSFESNLAMRVNELSHKLNDERRIREVDIRRLDLTYQDIIHTQDSTRMILENYLTGILSESVSKQMERETSSRIINSQKISEFEKLFLNEKETRHSKDKDIHARINEVMERATSYQHESFNEIRTTLKQNQGKTNEAMQQVVSGMRLIEQNSDESLRKYYQVISAEIAARKKLNESIKADVVILEEKIRAATAAMQLAVSGLANRIQNKTEIDELKQTTDKRICDFQLYMSRNFADIDSQLQILTGQISTINLNVETRIAQATSDISSEVRETLSSVMSWQANSTAHLREMQSVRVSVMQELAKMQLTLNHIESEIPSQMTMETDERIQAIGDIRHQMESLKIIMNSQPAVNEMDIDKIHESIRKLAETLQSIKSTMGMKIQSEQEMRLQQIKDLQTEMRYIEDQFMLQSKPPIITEKIKHYIIKPPEDSKEDWHKGPAAFVTINQWSLYSIWKWTKYKEKLILWKNKAMKNKGKRKNKKGGFWKKSKK